MESIWLRQLLDFAVAQCRKISAFCELYIISGTKASLHFSETADMSFKQLNPGFDLSIGPKPKLELCLEITVYPFAHETGVYFCARTRPWSRVNASR